MITTLPIFLLRSKFGIERLLSLVQKKKIIKNKSSNKKHLLNVCQDDISVLEELLNKDNDAQMHTRNIQVLATEIYKVKNGIVLSLLTEDFKIVNPVCNLRNKRESKSSNVKTISFGKSPQHFLAQKYGVGFQIM